MDDIGISDSIAENLDEAFRGSGCIFFPGFDFNRDNFRLCFASVLNAGSATAENGASGNIVPLAIGVGCIGAIAIAAILVKRKKVKQTLSEDADGNTNEVN